MAYQRQYLQQTQARTTGPATAPAYDYSNPIKTEFGRVFTGWKGHPGAREIGNYYGYAARDGKNKPWDYNEYWAMGNDLYGRNVRYELKPGDPGTSSMGRVRRGEMANASLRISMAQGKRRLRIEPTELGQLPGRDLPPQNAENYDPFTASEAESLAGLRRRRGPQVDLSINSANAASGLNTL